MHRLNPFASRFGKWSYFLTKTRYLTFCVALSMLWSLTPGIVLADAADDAYQLAAGYYKLSRWDLAADGFRKFISNYPQNARIPTARFFLGLSLVNRSQFKDARDALVKFVEEAPKSRNLAHAYYRIAECSYLMDDLGRAETELSFYVSRFPDDPLIDRALPYLGDVQLRLNKTDAAMKSFQQAKDKFPMGPLIEECSFGLAKCHESKKSFDQAINIYRILAANTKSRRAPEAQLSLGSRLFEQKKYSEALSAFADLEKVFPMSTFIGLSRLNQGACLFELGQFPNALEKFVAAESDAAQLPEARYWRARCLAEMGQHQESETFFQGLYDKDSNHPLIVRVLYYLGLEEQRIGKFTDAFKHFMECVDRFPSSEQADDCLHLASLVALDSGKLDEATRLIDRFQQAYPNSQLKPAQDLLRGRIHIVTAQYSKAIPLFQSVLSAQASELDRHWARYYLGFAQLELGHPAEALDSTETLLQAIETPAASPLVPVLLLRGAAQLTLGNNEPVVNTQRELYAAAMESASRYLTKAPNGKDVDQALALRALAAAHSGLKEKAKADVEELQKSHPSSAETDKTIHEVAEVAYSNQDWEWAGQLFGILAGRDSNSKYRLPGLSGQAWSYYQSRQFGPSASLFAKISNDFPEHKDAAEAAFMRGKAIQSDNMLMEAIAIFDAVFAKYGNSKFAYLAGLESARLRRQVMQYSEADKAYERLLQRFKSPEHFDKILNEWASANYEGGDFARSDEIFRKLIQEVPDSDLADNAKLSLAESELLAGKIDIAKEKFKALADDRKSDEEVLQAALFQLIGIASVQSDWRAMKAESQTLATRFPTGKHAWFAELKRGEAELNLGEHPACIDRLRKVIAEKTNPAVAMETWFGDAWVLLAEALHREKKHDDVQNLLNECITWNPDLPVLYAILEVSGRSFKAQARFPEAIAQFRKVIEHEHGRRTQTAAKSQFLIGDIYVIQKNFVQAEEEFLKVEILYKFPEWQAPALFQAGCCQEELMNWSDSAKHFKNVIKNYPKSEYAKMAADHLVKVQAKLDSARESN